jgi:hypothetical protein
VFPLFGSVLVFAALYECRIDLHLGSEQVFPLIPAGIPYQAYGSVIDPKLQFATGIAVQSTVVVEIAFAKRGMKPALPTLWQESQNAVHEKGLAITRTLADSEQRAEATIGKGRGALRVGQERVITGMEFWLS